MTVEQSQERADGRCAASLEGALRRTTTQYDTCITKGKDIRLRRGKVHYALLPVWMLHTKWNDKDFLFAMNGQTGKLVGDPAYGHGQVLGHLRRHHRTGKCHCGGDTDADVRRAAEMKKRILTYLLALLAVLTMLVPTWAEQTEDDLFIYDTVGLLDEDEWLELEMMADEISWRYNCGVYIVTVDDYEDYNSDIHYAAVAI